MRLRSAFRAPNRPLRDRTCQFRQPFRARNRHDQDQDGMRLEGHQAAHSCLGGGLQFVWRISPSGPTSTIIVSSGRHDGKSEPWRLVTCAAGVSLSLSLCSIPMRSRFLMRCSTTKCATRRLVNRRSSADGGWCTGEPSGLSSGVIRVFRLSITGFAAGGGSARSGVRISSVLALSVRDAAKRADLPESAGKSSTTTHSFNLSY